MDIINEEYSEAESALSFIDKEYDIPQVRDAVHYLLQEEMKCFAPSSSYLKHLPYPTLKFSNSPMLQAEYARVRDGAAPTMTKLDTKRYNVDAPEPAMERDVQAWRSAVANGKAQREHQTNRLINLELADQHIGSVWLNHNKGLENYEKQLTEESELVKRKIGSLSAARRREQESVQPELKKLQARTAHAVWTNWQVADACSQMEQYLLSQGVKYDGEEEVEEVEEEDENGMTN